MFTNLAIQRGPHIVAKVAKMPQMWDIYLCFVTPTVLDTKHVLKIPAGIPGQTSVHP